MKLNNLFSQKVNNTIYILAILIGTFILFPKNTYAYLDPGSGSYVVQILIASLAGLGFFIKTYWNQIRSIFSRKNKGSKKKSDEQD